MKQNKEVKEKQLESINKLLRLGLKRIEKLEQESFMNDNFINDLEYEIEELQIKVEKLENKKKVK